MLSVLIIAGLATRGTAPKAGRTASPPPAVALLPPAPSLTGRHGELTPLPSNTPPNQVGSAVCCRQRMSHFMSTLL